MAKGMEEGMAKGMEAANMESARRMKAKGFGAEDIADITGIPADIVNSL